MDIGLFRPDYVKFILEVPALAFHERYWSEFERCVLEHYSLPTRRSHHKLTVLGSRDPECRRYVIEVWGEPAGSVFNLGFSKWAEHMTRLDLRANIYQMSPRLYEKLRLGLQYSRTRLNVETFKTAKRSKKDGRDAGGRGVRVGSRKSDICFVLYQRAEELPAIEFRFIDAVLAEVFEGAADLIEEFGDTISGWKTVCDALTTKGLSRANGLLFQAGIDHSLDGLSEGDIPVPQDILDLYQLELALVPDQEPEDPTTYDGQYVEERGFIV